MNELGAPVNRFTKSLFPLDWATTRVHQVHDSLPSPPLPLKQWLVHCFVVWAETRPVPVASQSGCTRWSPSGKPWCARGRSEQPAWTSSPKPGWWTRHSSSRLRSDCSAAAWRHSLVSIVAAGRTRRPGSPEAPVRHPRGHRSASTSAQGTHSMWPKWRQNLERRVSELVGAHWLPSECVGMTDFRRMQCLDHRSFFTWKKGHCTTFYVPPSPHAMLFVRKGLAEESSNIA